MIFVMKYNTFNSNLTWQGFLDNFTWIWKNCWFYRAVF